LFPTLCHEGFGLSLIEALYTGNYCIASALGGVPEVLQNGQYGKLIENPHFIEEWIDAIDEFLHRKNDQNLVLPKDMYSADLWKQNMDKLIIKAKELF
jgi:glycosyltransferase involved in cell wall biosynthesis